MEEQILIQKILQRKLVEVQAVNPKFSVRALAKKIQMQPSAANEILKGKRRVSKKNAQKIMDLLKLDPSERNLVLSTFPKVLIRKKRVQSPNLSNPDLIGIKLKSQEFELISDWIHFALLSILKLKDVDKDPKALGQRFGMATEKISVALANLESLRLIVKDEEGFFQRTQSGINTSDDVMDLSIQKAHLNTLELARKKISLPIKDRDYSSYIFNINKKALPKLKEHIRRFQDEMEAIGEDVPEGANEVYQLSTYLFPLTNSEEEGEVL